jgi:hypothetical protein
MLAFAESATNDHSYAQSRIAGPAHGDRSEGRVASTPSDVRDRESHGIQRGTSSALLTHHREP